MRQPPEFNHESTKEIEVHEERTHNQKEFLFVLFDRLRIFVVQDQ
jgi:hypothetical protein